MKRAKWILALLLTVLPVLAAAQLATSQRIATQVPFEFVVGNRVVPAGEYVVRSAAMGGTVLLIQNVRAKISLFSTDARDVSKKPSDTCALVFKKYGDQHFLWKLKIEGSKMIYRLPESKAEAELRARNASSQEEILIASAQ